MFVPMDLTKADVIPEGLYVATITSVELKDSKKGTQYLNWIFFVPEANQNVFHSTSLTVPRMVKQVVDAAGAKYDSSGFNPEDCLNKQILITLAVKEDPEYGLQNVVTKISKA